MALAYQRTILATGTSFNPEENGVWTLADCNGDGTPDLVYIKTRNTGSGKIEVHYALGEAHFQQPYQSHASLYAVEDNGTWLMQDWNGDGRADLIYIKTRNTGTNTIEVHVASAASNYQNFIWHSGSCFSIEDNGIWTMSSKGDLVYIKTKNTGTNMIEIHVASRATNYQAFTVHEGTGFHLEDNGTWCIPSKNTGDYPDLYYIKTKGVDKIEVHAVSASSQWKSRLIDVKSGFSVEDNGYWSMVPFSRQTQPDLVYIKTRNTGTGKVEVHINDYTPVAPAPAPTPTPTPAPVPVVSAPALHTTIIEPTPVVAPTPGGFAPTQGGFTPTPIASPAHGGFAPPPVELPRPVTPTPIILKSFADSARNIRLNGTILFADLARNNGSWQAASVDLDILLGNINGKLTWNRKLFYETARNVNLRGSVLMADLKDSAGEWRFSAYDLANSLLNNDGAFQVI